MRNIFLILLMLNLGGQVWAKDLVIHEWGTFTSFMGSDGNLQEGLHFEEEKLPNFVYGVGNSQEPIFDPGPFPSDDPCPDPTTKTCGFFTSDFTIPIFGESLPLNPITTAVTQKMETPVIYFYGDVGTKVKVNIGFPEGIISQYYPKASSYSPRFSDIQGLGPSQFTFDVELKAIFDNDYLPYVSDESIWLPARKVQANTISVGMEDEKFIFYRGVANFNANFKVTSNNQNLLNITNESKQSIPAAFVLISDGEKGKIVSLGEITESIKAQAPTLDQDSVSFSLYVKDAKNKIAQALVNTGLYEDEAQAMVNTWEKSYFHTPGLRILYIVPNIETENILPMDISPKPKSLVRTLVGRVEVMTYAEEQMAIKYLLSGLGVNDLNRVFGRFMEPKLKRISSLVQESNLGADLKNDIYQTINSLLN